MKRIVVLGSTGSIGRNTLAVISKFSREFSLLGIAANSNIAVLSEQARRFHPEFVGVADVAYAGALKKSLGAGYKVLAGPQVIAELASCAKADLIVLAISGSAALLPLIAAIQAGKKIALANKESLVMAGDLLMRMSKKTHAQIIPVDSEQSAIWQCLQSKDRRYLRKIYLTASGGPFFGKSKKQLATAQLRQVLQHPRWKMGKKISVDSATLMNKGLEVIEAKHLFGLAVDQIEVLIHPEVIIHSMVEFNDRTILAQMSFADMRLPIQYALSYPERLSNGFPGVDFLKVQKLTFARPDTKMFPCLKLAYQAAHEAGIFPCALNAANEAAVEAFLQKKIDFLKIPAIIEKVLEKMPVCPASSIETILAIDAQAKEEARKIIGR